MRNQEKSAGFRMICTCWDLLENGQLNYLISLHDEYELSYFHITWIEQFSYF